MADIKTEAAKTPTLQEQLKAHETETQAGINKAYDANLTAQKQSLLDAYNANSAGLASAGDTIRQNRDTLNNDLRIQAARNQGNLNQFADVRQVNRQPGSQAALGMNMANAAAAGSFGRTAQMALEENERQKQLAATTYQNQVQAALADNDYKKAAALLDDYNNQNTWREKQAANIATYGNFDAYKDLYGDDTAANMRNVWLRQNPDTAYAMGAISPGTYRNITGRWPAGYTPPSSGGWTGWGYVPGGSGGKGGKGGTGGAITPGAGGGGYGPPSGGGGYWGGGSPLGGINITGKPMK